MRAGVTSLLRRVAYIIPTEDFQNCKTLDALAKLFNVYDEQVYT